MISPLQLNNYFVKEMSFRTNPAYQAEPTVRNEGKLLCSAEFGKAAEVPDHFMVSLVLTVEPSEVTPALDPYHIKMRIEGYFNFNPGADIPQSEKERMVNLNGCSILLGLARGLVAQATGVSEFGKYLLPAVNFVEMFKNAEQGNTGAIGATDVPAMASGEK
jgi:preprotein translocase subunit SecB